jgi:hypothetical protein
LYDGRINKRSIVDPRNSRDNRDNRESYSTDDLHEGRINRRSIVDPRDHRNSRNIRDSYSTDDLQEGRINRRSVIDPRDHRNSRDNRESYSTDDLYQGRTNSRSFIDSKYFRDRDVRRYEDDIDMFDQPRLGKKSIVDPRDPRNSQDRYEADIDRRDLRKLRRQRTMIDARDPRSQDDLDNGFDIHNRINLNKVPVIPGGFVGKGQAEVSDLVDAHEQVSLRRKFISDTPGSGEVITIDNPRGLRMRETQNVHPNIPVRTGINADPNIIRNPPHLTRKTNIKNGQVGPEDANADVRPNSTKLREFLRKEGINAGYAESEQQGVAPRVNVRGTRLNPQLGTRESEVDVPASNIKFQHPFTSKNRVGHISMSSGSVPDTSKRRTNVL